MSFFPSISLSLYLSISLSHFISLCVSLFVSLCPSLSFFFPTHLDLPPDFFPSEAGGWKTSDFRPSISAQSRGEFGPNFIDVGVGIGVFGTLVPKKNFRFIEFETKSFFFESLVSIFFSAKSFEQDFRRTSRRRCGFPEMDFPDNDSTLKDFVLTSLLMLAISGLAYVYRQYQNSQDYLKKVMADIDGLSKAEETLKDMQDSLQQQQQQQQQQQRRQSKQHQLGQQLQQSEDGNDPFPDFLSPETVEVSRLREEVEILRSELQQAEIRSGPFS